MRIELANIPTDPGCYQFKDINDNILYIGKAKNLRKRVKSYFQKSHGSLDPKTQVLVSKVESVDFIVTENEVEALILENNLIKKHQPKYNIDFKDSKRYSYIELTREDFPRLLIGRRQYGTSRFFGPFVNAQARDYVLYVLRRTFKIRTCKRMPKRACLRYHIHLCSAPCIDRISVEDYHENVKKVTQILKGNTKGLVKELTDQMLNASSKQDYESALKLRNQIDAIYSLTDKQAMERQKRYNEDIINFIEKNNRVYLILFNVYKGTLENKQEYDFRSNDEFFEEFLIQYYSENPVPKELIIPENVDESIISYLRLKRGSTVKVTVPKRGEKKRLLELVNRNIQVSFFGNFDKLEELRDNLDLQEVPSIIECFDISHLSGTSTTASMVQFRSALPDKNNYRRFKIRSVEGIDDPAAIAEVVRRRYSRLIAEGSEMPNLILIDGGLGQLNAAQKVLWNLDLKIQVVAIAKRFEELYLPGKKIPIVLDKKSKALQLLQQIRDEAHRFALQYNRLLRKKELTE